MFQSKTGKRQTEEEEEEEEKRNDWKLAAAVIDRLLYHLQHLVRQRNADRVVVSLAAHSQLSP